MIVKYFTTDCPACHRVEDDPSILQVIKMRYRLRAYDVRLQRHLSEVRDWLEWADGRVPALEIEGNGEVKHYTGVKDFVHLAKKCQEWLGASNGDRPNIEPTYSPIDVSGEADILLDIET